MHKHLEKMGEVTFDKIFNQKLGECAGIRAVCATGEKSSLVIVLSLPWLRFRPCSRQ